MKKTCKDCIYAPMCRNCNEYVYNKGRCEQFKDKSKFIEKPFDIRDHIYIITKYSYSSPYEIIKCMVTKMRLKDGNTVTFSCEGHYANFHRYTSGNFKTSSIGKTVFLTKEEAEKKLEEMNK